MKNRIGDIMDKQYTLKDVIEAVEYEGFDYALADYCDWSSVKNKRFQQLYNQYLNVREELKSVIENGE